MKRPAFISRGIAGLTLLEMLISAGIGAVVMAILVSVTITIQRSIKATDHYIVSINNGSRLNDYIGRDLRRAVRVGRLTAGTHTPLKNNASFIVTESDVLTINIPDVHASNDAKAAGFKVARYDRRSLNSGVKFNSYSAGSPLNGIVPWNEAITKVASKDVPRFAPSSAGNGEIQVRYSRGPRSSTDPTVCYFRAEYAAASSALLSGPHEIAQLVASNDTSTSLSITAPNLPATDGGYGRTFTLETSFIPRYSRGNTSRVGTTQQITVRLRNLRRD